MDLGRVFISSVFGGMLDLRDLAAKAARLVGLEPVLTERHVAQAGTVQERLAKEIALCDTYVGLFDRRRGTVPDGTDSQAITEEEFRIARENGLRCLVFLSKIDDADRQPELKDFLDREVSEYSTGVWTRYYKDEAGLAREIAAALSVLRPRVVVTLSPREGRKLEACLHLEGVQPAWKGPAVLGPAEVDLTLGGGAEGVFRAFLEDAARRSQLKEESLRVAGGELAAQAFPGELGEALQSILAQAAHHNRLVTLEVRTGDTAALAIPWELLSFPNHPLPVRQGLIEIVRHLPPPGQDPNPSHDPAPEIPADHIAVLGFTASPLEDQAVTALPGTGGMRDSDLFWEREQERLLVALDDLVRTGRGRLILPDTGDKEELRHQLYQKDRPQIVHLSCHGGMAEGQPSVFLEDEEGHRAAVGADDLLSWIRATPGAAPLDLLVLSACDTAEAAGLADLLVRGGVPRVLGMQSTVSDAGATAFAGAFYAALAQGSDLPAAMRAGRAELAAKGGNHEWAIPTFTASRDAGPLVAPRGSALPVPAPFEVVRKDFEIEGITYLAGGYVGRREVDRRLRRAFKDQRVIAIHGLGGIGKSTLVARFLERRREDGARVLLLYAGRDLAPASLIEEVAKKVGVEHSGALPPDQAEQQFNKDLQAALRAVHPTILFLDNFEDNQDGDGHLKNPTQGEALADLVQLGGPEFRLLFTSRLPVDLPDFEVWNYDLGEISPSGCRKLRLLDPKGLGSLDETAWRQVMFHLGGHPKALELLGGYLKGRPDRVRTLLENFGEAIESVDRRLAAKRQERGRSLLVETVLAEVPEERLPVFDSLCLLEEPLSSEELDSLLVAEGIGNPDLAWFRNHGLLARKVAPSALAGGDAVHRLLASRRGGALTEREGGKAARAWHLRVAEHLVRPGKPLTNYGIAARHRDVAGDRAGALELYDQWAMSFRDRHAYIACVQVAQEGIERFPPDASEASRMGVARLWMRVADGLEPLGMVSDRTKSLELSLSCLGEGESKESRFTRASVNLRLGRDLIQKGEVHSAEERLQEALSDFKKGDYERDAAITLGDIARLRSQAGDVAGALKLHEEELRTYEQLGDVRSRAVTLGDIARLRSQAGDVAGALKLFEEKLHIVAQLGDVRSRAVTLGDIAQLRMKLGDIAGAREFQEQNLEIRRSLGDLDGIANAQFYLASLDLEENRPADARPRLAESWKIVLETGVASGIAFVGQLYGQVLAGTDRGQAISVLRTSLEVFQRLGMTDEVIELAGILKSLETDGGEDASTPESSDFGPANKASDSITGP
jgi:tetratricopeptide (TPR) repeat protein